MKRRVLPVLLFSAGLLMIGTFNMRSQLCGKSFGRFVVADAEGKEVSDVTAELLGDLPQAIREMGKLL